MTRQADVERLARFMGWTYSPDAWPACRQITPKGKDHPYLAPETFDPFNSLDDAMMVAEKIGAGKAVNAAMFTFKNWNYYGDRTYTAQFLRSGVTDIKVEERGKTLAEAIALAALAYLDAVGFK